VLRPALEKLHAQIAVSESARLVVVQHLGRDAVVIPNGFRADDFAAPPGPACQADRRLRLLFLGRTDEPRKGLDVLLAALPAIRRAVPDLEVVVAGQGARPLPADCVGYGLVDDREKADLLASADVFVAPHRARESFGIVVLEAMASGTPVVASDLPPFAELLGGSGPGPADRGVLFAGGRPDELAQAVVDTLRRPDPARADRASEHARRFDWSVVGRAVESVYWATLDAAYGDVSAGTG
jgi:phosphatidylinositol alpha-mannosyltransferase